MGECKTANSCETEHSCGHGHGGCCGHGHDHDDRAEQQEEGCTMAEDILCLAKSAKHDLLKEKMKKLLEVKIGKKLDQVAEVAVDAIHAHMQQTLAEKQACAQYKEKLMAVFKG